jgi:hypothetical protein
MPVPHKAALLGAVALLLLLEGCGKKEIPPPAGTKPTTVSKATEQRAEGVPVPAEEPSEDDLRKLEFQTYEAIEQAGGLPVTVTATGQSLTLRPKLYDVRKNSCKPSPHSPPGWYECSLTIKLSLKADGSNPSEQGERIDVKWDPSGRWVLQ